MHYLREKASQKWMNKRRTEINNEISNSRDLSKSMDLFTKWVTYTTLSEKQQQVHLNRISLSTESNFYYIQEEHFRNFKD